MIAQPSLDSEQILNSLSWKQKSSMAKKYSKTSNQQKDLSPSKKGALSTLVQSVNLDFFNQMIPSSFVREIPKKIIQSPISQQQAECEEIQPIEPLNKNKTIQFQPSQKLFKENKTQQSSNKIQTTQLNFKFSFDHIRVKKLQQSIIIETDEQLQIYNQMCKAKKDTKDQFISKKQISNHEQKLSKNVIKFMKNQKYGFVSESTGESSSEDEKQNAKSLQKKSFGIKDFQQISLLGEGVYGRVSLAKHKQSNLLVALKKIAKCSLNKEDSIYLSREIKIQSFAQHPNIVQLYTFFHDQDNIYLVLEVCNQGNLFSLLHKEGGKLPEEKVKKYIRQICSAVQFLHNKQIIHRDLKPENILVHNGVAKICDFGWAVHAPQLRSTLCGTPLYSSPELIKNQKYDLKLDIWNIGVLTYELICGKVPFDIKIQEDLAKIVDTEVIYPTNGLMSQHCINFIKGCLQKDPRDRYEIWQLLRHPFINIEEKLRQSLQVMWGQRRN